MVWTSRCGPSMKTSQPWATSPISSSLSLKNGSQVSGCLIKILKPTDVYTNIIFSCQASLEQIYMAKTSSNTRSCGRYPRGTPRGDRHQDRHQDACDRGTSYLDLKNQRQCTCSSRSNCAVSRHCQATPLLLRGSGSGCPWST